MGIIAGAAWTPVEDDLMRQIYPKGGAVACALVMPNRTVKAIHRRASRLEVACDSSKHCGRRSSPQSAIPVQDYSAAHIAWQEIDRKTTAIPAANGPAFLRLGVAA